MLAWACRDPLVANASASQNSWKSAPCGNRRQRPWHWEHGPIKLQLARSQPAVLPTAKPSTRPSGPATKTWWTTSQPNRRISGRSISPESSAS